MQHAAIVQFDNVPLSVRQMGAAHVLPAFMRKECDNPRTVVFDSRRATSLNNETVSTQDK